MTHTIKNPLITATLWALTSLTATAQTTTPPQASPSNQVQLSATGATEVQQDVLTITLRATKDGTDATAVQTYVKSVLDSALQEGRAEAEIDKLAIKTGNFGMQPRYGKDSKIVGWQGTGEVIISGRDLVKISKLAGRIQNMSISNAQFGLSSEEKHLAQSAAQILAINNFKTKAEQITSQFGFKEYTLREITISSEEGFHQRPQLMGMQVSSMARVNESDAPVPVEAGKATVSASVSGSINMN
jgi:predicted secreted protein